MNEKGNSAAALTKLTLPNSNISEANSYREPKISNRWSLFSNEIDDPAVTSFNLTHMSQLRDKSATLFNFRTHAAKHSTIDRGTPKNEVFFFALPFFFFVFMTCLFSSLSLSRFHRFS